MLVRTARRLARDLIDPHLAETELDETAAKLTAEDQIPQGIVPIGRSDTDLVQLSVNRVPCPKMRLVFNGTKI